MSLSVIEQRCENCAFETGPIQCYHDRIRKFSHKGIVRAENGHAIVVGRKCNYFYNKERLDKSVEDAAQEVIEASGVHPPIIVAAIGADYNLIKQTMDSVLTQTVLPPYTWIISDCVLKDIDIKAIKQDYPLSKFKYQLIGKNDLIEPYLDSAVNRIGNYQFYLLTYAGSQLPPNIIERVNTLINEDCGRFVHWSGSSFDVFLTAAHKMVGGHSMPFLDFEEAECLEDKLEWWANKHEMSNLIIEEGSPS